MGVGIITEDYLNMRVSEDQSSVLAATQFCRLTVCVSKCRACSVFTLNRAWPCSALLGPALPSVISQKKRPRSLWLISETGGSPWPITEQSCRQPSASVSGRQLLGGSKSGVLCRQKSQRTTASKSLFLECQGFSNVRINGSKCNGLSYGPCVQEQHQLKLPSVHYIC